MRIMHVTSLFAPDRVGGAEIFVGGLARAQVASGHAVAVVTTSRERQVTPAQEDISVYRQGHNTPFFILDWARQARWKQKYYKFAVQADRKFGESVVAAINDFRPDVVNTHSLSELSTNIWSAIAAQGIPIVHTLHDFTSMCTNGSLFHDGHVCDGSRLQCRMFAHVHRRHARHVGAVVGVGADIVERHLGAKFFTHVPHHLRRVIWNSVPEPEHVRSRTPPKVGESVVFGYLGRLEPAKGADLLLDAAKRLPKGGWRLIMAGQVPDADTGYIKSAAGLPVTFPGYVDADEFFDEIDCLIVPPLWPEAFGRTVAEACLRGIQVIGSDIAGVAEQVNAFGSGMLVASGSVDMLADAMRDVIEDHSRLAVRGADIDGFAERVRPGAIADAYIELYDQLCSPDPLKKAD